MNSITSRDIYFRIFNRNVRSSMCCYCDSTSVLCVTQINQDRELKREQQGLHIQVPMQKLVLKTENKESELKNQTPQLRTNHNHNTRPRPLLQTITSINRTLHRARHESHSDLLTLVETNWRSHNIVHEPLSYAYALFQFPFDRGFQTLRKRAPQKNQNDKKTFFWLF